MNNILLKIELILGYIKVILASLLAFPTATSL